VLVIISPGQGSQLPGFLSPWLELPGIADQLATWSELAGRDLVHYGTAAGADEIRDTAVAQPLLVAAAMAAAGALFGHIEDAPRLCGAVAGHSVGELSAGAIAGVISAEDAMRLIRVRGEAMAKAAAAEPTGMTAILGGGEAEVLAAIDAHGLTPANVNATGQIVAAGTAEQLAALAADPPRGARLRPLQVAGAFHTRHMAPAVDALRHAAEGVTANDPRTTLLSNRDGAAVRSGPEWLERIAAQVSEPVRWDQCMRSLAGMGASAVIELPPAGTLTGLARRALPGMALLAMKSPADLDAARGLVAAHAVAAAEHTPEWRLLVAPLGGTFNMDSSATEGTEDPNWPVAPGAEIGYVDARGARHPIIAPCSGHVVEWLVENADPVSAGQPLARLQPEKAE
jgi:[acyl-carrier-protein] S-malonyltransferase